MMKVGTFLRSFLQKSAVPAAIQFPRSSFSTSVLLQKEKAHSHHINRAVAAELPAQGHSSPQFVCRWAGETNLLIEYGPLVLDMHSRIRVHFLEQALKETTNPLLARVVEETCPGVRSVMIKLKIDEIPSDPQEVVRALVDVEKTLPSFESDISIESRRLRLPIVLQDEQCKIAISKYQQTVRSEAPYLPDNFDFLARCNGLDSKAALEENLLSSTFMVLGLGDVYLGAPCAVNLDPRKRLVTPKYSPARTYTPEGAVGIGGAYMCIYPMASPGGYMLVGRSLPIWNARQDTRYFQKSPWFLRFFDRVEFYPVSEREMQKAWVDFRAGNYPLDLEDIGQFNLKEYDTFLKSIEPETKKFQAQQKKAIKEASVGLEMALVDPFAEEEAHKKGAAHLQGSDLEHSLLLQPGESVVSSPISGSLLRISKQVGDVVQAGEELFVLSAMKMELPVKATKSGVVTQILPGVSSIIDSGQPIVIVKAQDTMKA